MKELRKGLIWLYGALGAVGLTATLVSSLNNTVRHWFLTHAPAGWYAALGAGIALCVALGMLSATQAKARRLEETVNDLQVASDGDAPSSAQLEDERQRRASTHATDQRLLEELLDGWRPNDEVIHWLTADFFVGHAPIRLFDQVYNHAVLWQSEPREFASEKCSVAQSE